MTKGKATVQDDGTVLTVSCEDYGADIFGGGDYEFTYRLERENREELLSSLKEEGLSGTAENLVLGYFGESLDKVPFRAYCDRHGIQYTFNSWVS